MSRRPKNPRIRPSAVAVEDLPALSTLRDLPSYEQLRPLAQQRARYAEITEQLVVEGGVPSTELYMGCVVRLDRGFPAIASEYGFCRAEFSARFTKSSSTKQESERVAVGDWVCLRIPAGHDHGLIEALLPRKNAIARWRGGGRGQRQTLAANVDLVLVAQPLSTHPLMCDRIVRSVVIARDCGAEVAVVLTKADCVSLEAVKDAVKVVRATLGTEISVVVTAAGAASDWRGPDSINAGIERLRSLICPYTVAIVLGQSGAGKSTLLNALLGRDTLCVGKVRTSDGAGRHTTVSRRMVGLAGAGAIVDEPGLRSLPLMGHERGLALVFPEIVSAAQACRFRDCTHTSEPGCAVREALAHGSFSAEHLNAYLSLAAEMRDSAAGLDPDILP